MQYQFPNMKKFYKNYYRKGCYLFLSICILVNIPSFIPKNNSQKKDLFIAVSEKRTLTLSEKQGLFLQMANNLAADGLLSISPERFAKICMVTSYCESNLRTDAKSDDQQGIWQWTAATRKKRGFPENILNDDFPTQVGYCEMYLRSVSQKLKYIRTSEDLHVLKFAPSRIHLTEYSEVTEKLVPLDKDKDGKITKNDITLFQIHRVKENKVIKQLFEEVRSKNIVNP